MLFNSGGQSRDIEVIFSRDLPDSNLKWAREFGPRPGGCVDKDKENCPKWASNGQCKDNPGG